MRLEGLRARCHLLVKLVFLIVFLQKRFSVAVVYFTVGAPKLCIIKQMYTTLSIIPRSSIFIVAFKILKRFLTISIRFSTRIRNELLPKLVSRCTALRSRRWRRRVAGWHMIRSLVGPAGMMLSIYQVGHAFRITDWPAIAGLAHANEHGAALDAFLRSPDEKQFVVAAIVLLLSIVLLAWPPKKAAPTPGGSNEGGA